MRSVTSVAPSEYAPFYETYVSRVPEGDIVQILSGQIADTLRLLGSVPSDLEEYRYRPGKWSVREVVGHMIDTERVFAFRADAWSGKGVASSHSFTVRSVSFIIAGHEIHHRTGLEENYMFQPKGGGAGGRTS